MKRHSTPQGYTAPLRSRVAILAFLKTAQNARPFYGLFAFNVKVGAFHWTFDALLAVARKGEMVGEASTRYLSACRELWKAQNKERLFERALEACREAVVSQDTHRMLWDGEEAIAEWEFAGRSGGWLVLERFEGYPLSGRGVDWEIVEGMEYPQLRRLYRFVIQCQHDFQRRQIDAEVTHQAAWAFFVNICEADVESDAKHAERMEREANEAQERAHWECRDTVTV